jgi:hypothetical protein
VSDREQGAGLTEGPSRVVVLAAVAVATAAVAAVLAVAAIQHHSHTAPVVIAALPAPQADSPECRTLISALPGALGDYRRVTPAPPAPPAVAAWRAVDAEPVVLRCGLDRPAEFVVGSPIQVVNAVQWFQAPAGTWVAVDRPVYVALTLPAGSGPTPIQQLSDVIAATLPAVPIRPGPPS